MKTDFEILLTLLILIKVATTLRLTPKNSVSNAQHNALLGDIINTYRLAHYKMSGYYESNNVLGKKFFHIFYVLTLLPVRHKNAVMRKGVYELIELPDEYWKLASQILHSGFSKNDGLELFKQKRKLCHAALEMVMGTGCATHIATKKNIYIVETLLQRTIDFGVSEEYHLQENLSELDGYRYDAISSIYRLVDFIKQMGTMEVEGKKRNVISKEHIAWVKDKPNLQSVSAIGHINDVQIAHFLLDTKIHEPFIKSYMKGS